MNSSSKLTPTQELVLRNAVKRGGAIMPLPDKLNGGAKKKVFDSLLNKGFIGNLPASEGSDAVLYQITNEGREAIGEAVQEDITASSADEKEEVVSEIESEPASVKEETGSEPTDTEEDAGVEPDVPTEAEEEVQATDDADNPEQTNDGAENAEPLPEFKPLRGRARELAGILLTSEEGVTATKIGETMGLQTHSVRGMISRDIKKKGGCTVITGKDDRGQCTYRIDKNAA